MTAKARILLVEDNADLAYGLRNNLEIDGHVVITVETGEQALDQVRHRRPDLMIPRLICRGLDCYQVLRRPGRKARHAGTDPERRGPRRRTRSWDSSRRRRLRDQAFGCWKCWRESPRCCGARVANARAARRRASWRHREINQETRVVTRAGAFRSSMAPMEFALLLALIARRGSDPTTPGLAARLWGHARGGHAHRGHHIAELRRKLEEDPAHPVHILTVRKVLSIAAGHQQPVRRRP